MSAWWLLECGHYADAEEDTSAVGDVEFRCRTCSADLDHWVYRRRVYPVPDVESPETA